MRFLKNLRGAISGALLGFQASWGAYADATSISPDRGSIVFFLDHDTRQYLPSWTRREINRKVTWLFQNFGIVKECIRGIARHTVGKGICLSLNTDDEEWNALAEADFEAYMCAPDRVDLAGRRSGYEIQTFSIEQRVKQGEFIAAFVPNPRWDGAPCLKLIDADEVETPEEHSDNPYIVDGIELDADHCMVAIYVRGLDDKFTRIERSQVIHWYHGDAVNQPRGCSDFAQAVANMCDIRELAKIVTKTAKQNSAIGLHITKMVKAGGQGAIAKLNTLRESLTPGSNGGNMAVASSSGDETRQQAQYEKLAGGGAVIYTDEKGDAKFLTPNSPSPLVEPWITKVLMRDGLASAGGASADFFWACADLSGAGQRFVISKADVFFTVFGDGNIGHVSNPLATRYLMHRMESGKLRRPLLKGGAEDTQDQWLSCVSFQLPARISIDRGDALTEIAQLANGVETLSSINDRRGRGWRPMVKQWFREFAFATAVAKEVGAEWALKLWRAGQPGAAMADPKADPTEDPPAPAKKPA